MAGTTKKAASKAQSKVRSVAKTAQARTTRQPKDQTADDSSFVPTVKGGTTGSDDGKLGAEGYGGKPKEFQQDFTYPTHTDPARKIPGTNVYLDDVERQKAEIQRAAVEEREPDLENAPAYQGSPLLPTHVIAANNPGDFVVEADVTLPVIAGRPDADEPEHKVEAVPTYSVSKSDLDEQGRVAVGSNK